MAVNNSLVEAATGVQKQTFSSFLTGSLVKQKINEVIGGKDGQRFMTQILSAVTNNPELAKCDPMTVLNCAFLGEGLKLSPSPQLGQYYMVPFNNKKKNNTPQEGIKDAQFILGYKGYVQLAIRSGQYKKLNVLAIKQGELINYDPLNEEIEVNLIEDEVERENAETIGYYAMFEYINGFRKTMYWSKGKMELHADKYSAAYSTVAAQKIKDGTMPQKQLWMYSGYWYKDFDGQAFKTMLRQLISKWGIMSIDLQKAMEGDAAVPDAEGNFNYVGDDVTPDVPEIPPMVEVIPEVVDDTPDDTPDFLK